MKKSPFPSHPQFRDGGVKARSEVLLALLLCLVAFALAACGGDAAPPPTATSIAAPTAAPAPAGPAIDAVTCDGGSCVGVEVPRYGRIELVPALRATYANPFDAREVALEALFTGPDGKEWVVPGYWDGETNWRVRFTPSSEGTWSYAMSVRDATGSSAPVTGQFAVTPSDRHGWLQVGSWVAPDYSPRYLAHHDGTPFYGIGHGEAFTMLSHGFDVENGFGIFDNMRAAGENTVVYWPLFNNAFFSPRQDNYRASDLRLIDLLVEDAARKNVYLIFTVWHHDILRDKNHPWGRGQWEAQNGFRALGDTAAFFGDDDGEMWAWQENLYRYYIARWGYSPAIGLWLTVSEIEGTSAGTYKDEWHTRVNDYFVANDPYRHPTSASMAGDQWWPEGYAVTDVPQIHSYDTDDMVAIGPRIAGWTQRMWDAEAKPNFIGEFGARGRSPQPDHLHNAIWAALAAGAALTPMDWNDGNNWGEMTPEMYAQMASLARFVADLPFVQLNPEQATLDVAGEGLSAWGLHGDGWGMAWVQDVSQAGKEPDEIRTGTVEQKGIVLTVDDVADGSYRVLPYDTWEGVYRDEFEATAIDGRLAIPLPEFSRDIAVRWERK
jgi:hypothetical protein